MSVDAVCTPPCPTDCESIFDRVVVSHLIKGPTRVSWELLNTFTDPGPLEFQLQVGTSNNPYADDWQNVGVPVVNQYVAYDAEQRVWGKMNWTHYRIVLNSPMGTYYSTPVGGLGVLDRGDWRIARNIVRERRLAYRKGPGGQNGYLLKRRWTGIQCKLCLDYQTEEVRNPHCLSCYGTGFECGYYYPQGCVFAELSPRSRHTELDGVQSRGTIDDIVVKAEMLMLDLIAEEDVWVAARSDDRYFVHRVTHKAEVRGVPLIGDVELRLIPFSHIIYGIEIPEQLRQLGLEV